MSFPVIDLEATGANIVRLRKARGLTVRDVQAYFGFEEPQAVYKWQQGKCLPTVDNLYALGALLEVPMDRILVPVSSRNWIKKSSRILPAALLLFRPVILDTPGGLGRSGPIFAGLCETQRLMQGQPVILFCPKAPYKMEDRGTGEMVVEGAWRRPQWGP